MNSFSANAIAAMLPTMETVLPFFGLVDLRIFVAAIIVFLGIIVVFKVVQLIIINRLRAFSKKTKTDIDDVLIEAIGSIRTWVYTVAAFFAAMQVFSLPNAVDLILKGLFFFAIVWQSIDIVAQLIDYGTKRYVEKDKDGDGVIDPNAATASSMVTLFSRVVLWALGGLFVLSNLGVEITSLIAGLGIGGIAIAFALQGVLGDLFASLSIYLDKPFRVGDFIIIGSDMGVVERIGIKSTRIKTLQGQELVVSNTELTTARVNNYKKMEERRIAVQFGITYETPQEKVREVPGIVKRIFENIDGARMDRAHFMSFGDFALIFEVVYYVTSADYNEYMDIQQAFNFELMQRFAEVGVEFAYPTQTLHVHKSE